ncbi:hypothetical protein DPEC_G00370320 [Dallia pectoralis]|nr:hypothetical protein DPEC_G00370320 [Dallia pectoralis]
MRPLNAVPRRVQTLPGMGTGQPAFHYHHPCHGSIACLAAYSLQLLDVLSRLDEVKARITSVFRSILRWTQLKVTNKLAGAAAKTAAWATKWGIRAGPPPASSPVLRAGLLPMATGLMSGTDLPSASTPQLMCVDRDCCQPRRIKRRLLCSRLGQAGGSARHLAPDAAVRSRCQH